MSWSAIADKVTSWLTTTDKTSSWASSSLELVPDSDFDDSGAWDIAGTGPPFDLPASNVEISTSQLKSTSGTCYGLVTPVVPVSLVTGTVYQWGIDVQSASGGGIVSAAVDDRVIWQVASMQSVGAVTVSGTFTYSGGTGLVFILSNKLVSINSVSIKQTTLWSSVSDASSSWSSITSKVTSWV